MTEKEYLKKLNINDVGYFSDDSYIIDIYSDEDYFKYYSKLEKSDLIELDEQASMSSPNMQCIRYYSDDFAITLLANFEEDIYSLVIKKV